MRRATKHRLLTALFMVSGVSVAVFLLLIALGSNMNHYYELNAIVSSEAPIGKTIRIGGIVQKGSIERQTGTLNVKFTITDLSHTINVKYTGVLPDLFAEEQGVLAKGKLINTKTFIAEQILAKHDENYMPEEVKAELEKNDYSSNYSDSPTVP